MCQVVLCNLCISPRAEVMQQDSTYLRLTKQTKGQESSELHPSHTVGEQGGGGVCGKPCGVVSS